MNATSKVRARKALAANLIKLREAQDLTQAELARKARVSRSTVARIETETMMPAVNVLADIASALDVPLDSLIAPSTVGVPQRILEFCLSPIDECSRYATIDIDADKRTATDPGGHRGEH